MNFPRNEFTKIFMFCLILTACASCNRSGAKNGSAFNWEQQDSQTSSQDIGKMLQDLPDDDLFQKARVVTFYENQDNQPVWSDSDTRVSLHDQLQQAEEEGLGFEDYHQNDLRVLLETDSRSPEENTRLDILLTDAFLTYADHLLYGKLDPEKIYNQWGVKRKETDLGEHLEQALESGDISGALNKLKPPHQTYKDLKVALQEYRALKKNEVSFTRVEGGDLIRPGEADPRIEQVAQRLRELEILDPSYEVQENKYDEELQEAVREFQRKKGLIVDGILGSSTYAELNMSPSDRYNQILANLERWRWYPRDLGEHYFLINIPDFKLAVVNEGDTVRTHSVIAGRKSRPTPVFSDQIQYIVINPDWTIPPTIKTKDVIPAASKDLSYLEENNITITNQDGETVDPSSIDWSDPEVRNYNFVQRPGPSNPLGRVKLIYPNQFLVYLHDTPAKSLFEKNERAESSGCVRVEEAIDLSAYALKDRSEWDQERINRTIASGETTTVEVTQPIQVHHFYWTAWRDNGKTVFTEDVYDLDKGVYNRLLNKN